MSSLIKVYLKEYTERSLMKFSFNTTCSNIIVNIEFIFTLWLYRCSYIITLDSINLLTLPFMFFVSWRWKKKKNLVFINFRNWNFNSLRRVQFFFCTLLPPLQVKHQTLAKGYRLKLKKNLIVVENSFLQFHLYIYFFDFVN